MKTNILILFISFIFILPVLPQSGDKQADYAKSGITFPETEYDFGTLKTGADAEHYFVFSNTGNAPIAILNVRASCGCMASEWPKAPLGPGMKDSLRVEYNTKIRGSFNKTIIVQSNAANASIELRIKGNVIKSK